MADSSGLLRKLMRRPQRPRRSSAPPGKVFYVIGDIHGRADLLGALLRKIAIDAARHEADLPRELIFLGDYIDRGPDSRQAVDLVLESLAERGDYLCVHAGVRPGVPLARQSEQDLLWIRDDFLGREHAFDKVIVHGHTPGLPFNGPHRIGLDTGAYVTGALTAIKLKDEGRTLMQAHGDAETAGEQTPLGHS